MSIQLPDAFVTRMKGQLGSEAELFLRTIEEPPVRGLRLNAWKKTDISGIDGVTDPVPWEKNGWYLSAESGAGATVPHEAGAFYIQDPSAMIPAAVLNAQPGETILDLCAAPGGKSTQIGLAMSGKGLLISNEPVLSMATVLSGNIERMGIPNAVVTCAWPEQLASKWGSAFDGVIADAPCSGEGMFRKDLHARQEWSEEHARGCAKRQREILESAAKLVCPGGRLVYSTCTWNPAENEDTVNAFLNTHPEFSLQPFELPGIDGSGGMFTCYPHQTRGEGQYTALMVRLGNGEKARLQPDTSLIPITAAERKLLGEFLETAGENVYRLGDRLISTALCPDIRGIRTLRTGVHLGSFRGKTLIPDHAAARAITGIRPLRTCELTADEALRYLNGETLPREIKGWTAVRREGMALGWAKGSDGMLKNHYPKGLRRSHLIPETAALNSQEHGKAGE